MNKNKSVFKRIVKPYFLLVTVILSVAFAFVYMAQLEKTKSEAYEAAEKIASQTAILLDSYIDGMNSIAEQVKHQDEITKYFFDAKYSGEHENIFEKDVSAGIGISSRLKNILVGRSTDYSIFIYNNCGDYVSSQNYMIDKDAADGLVKGGLYERELMRIRAADGCLITPLAENRWSKSKDEYITLAKELKNDYSDDGAGIIEIRAHLPSYGEEDFTNELIIRNRSDNTTIYPVGISPVSGYSYITAPLKNAQWDVMFAYGGSVKKTPDISTSITFLIMYAMLIVAMFLLTTLIGKHISKPIMRLSENVRKIALPGENLGSISGGIDEIDELEKNFSQMLTRLSQASQREKKAYALALQAQMNPHFLYNTLAVIGAQGLDEGSERVYNMCSELSGMLRYVAEYERVTVRLSEEWTHTKNYLSLMKARYEEYFDYTFTVDECLADMPVPKLFIQPLVENCFVHGFKNVEPPWRIDISMKGNTQSWELRIKDNGCGMSGGDIERILNDADNCTRNIEMRSIGGLGMVNTIVRLRLTHDKNTECIINGEHGTEIVIRTGEKSDV